MAADKLRKTISGDVLEQFARLWPLCGKLGSLQLRAASPSVEMEVLQPEEREETREAIHLPGEIDKITKVGSFHAHDPDIEFNMIGPFTATHAPVIRYSVRHALITPFGLFAGGSALRRTSALNPKVLATERLVRTLAAAFHDTAVTRRFFGHLIQDGLPSLLLAREGEVSVLTAPQAWRDVPAYYTALGKDPITSPFLFAERACFFQDYGQGTLKRERNRRIRQRLRAAFPDANPARRVYLRRPAGGRQCHIVNEAVLIDVLTQRGFEVIDPSELGTEELLRKLIGAEVSVGVDGSHLNHLYFALKEGGTALCMIENDRFTMNQASYCRANNLNPAFLILEGSAEAGYRVDPNRLLKTLEKAGVH